LIQLIGKGQIREALGNFDSEFVSSTKGSKTHLRGNPAPWPSRETFVVDFFNLIFN